jgi:predicted nucleic acid-binding protein
MIKRSYIDANLLIAAWKGDDEAGSAALAVLDDWERTLLVSDALWLEVMPKATYEKKHGEMAFYQSILERAEYHPWRLDVLRRAQELAQSYGIAAMDAIHVATALAAGADEFISAEKPTKPMFRVREMHMISLRGTVS